MLILEHNLTICLKVYPFIEEILRNAFAFCGKFCLKCINICCGLCMNSKSTSVDYRHILIAVISQWNDRYNLFVAYRYGYLITKNYNIERIRILVRFSADRNLITDCVGISGWMHLNTVMLSRS